MVKVAVVTGGSFGIGAAIVKKFLTQNYHVFNLDIAEPIQKHEHENFIACDIKSIAQINSAVEKIISMTNRVDVVISNAGKHLSATIENTSEEMFDEINNLNFKGAFFLLAAIIPIMKKQHEGAIVLIGSDQCFVGKPNSAIYGATKAALGQLTKSIAIDYANFNIRANCVCAGTIDTPLYQNAIINYSKKSGKNLAEIEKAEAKEQLLNRIGQPEEVADLVFFLASDQAKFITGGLFPIDGGYTAR